MRVVAVVVGVDQRADRLGGAGGDGVEERPGAPLGGAGVDGHDALGTHQEARVVQPPGAVRLDVGEDAVRDLVDVGRLELAVVVVAWSMDRTVRRYRERRR